MREIDDIPVEDKKRKLKATEELLLTMNTLRAKCPWDRKQSIASLRNLSIEELYELVDAIDEESMQGLKEELGDLLLHIVFYCKIAEEKKAFNWADVIEELLVKLRRRHPHIYGDTEVEDEGDVKRNWEQIKKGEKDGEEKSVLAGVPKALPAMVKAYRMQEKTAQVGFEWEDIPAVGEKVKEEVEEFLETVQAAKVKQERREEEFGDLLFSLINYARFLDIEPETALSKCNAKFMRRFRYIEKKADKDLAEMDLEEMDALWEKAKLGE